MINQSMNDAYLIILSRLTTLINYISDLSRFKCKLRCELSKNYLPQVGSSDELTYFLTYLYLFGNKCAKYQLSKILVFLMHRRHEPFHVSDASKTLSLQCRGHLHTILTVGQLITEIPSLPFASGGRQNIR